MCEDGMVRVLYQGELNPGQYLRAEFPMPSGTPGGKVSLKATFCYPTQTDPQDPGSYTRSGLEVTFRPHAQKFEANAITAKTKPFFKKSYFETEQALRSDAQKGETTLNAEKSFLATSLCDPFFDIHYNARVSGGAARHAGKLRYALVLTVRASRVPDLYDQVARNYVNQLEAFRPVIDIPVLLS